MGIDDLGTKTLFFQWFPIGSQWAWTLSHSRTGPIMTSTMARNHSFPKGFRGFQETMWFTCFFAKLKRLFSQWVLMVSTGCLLFWQILRKRCYKRKLFPCYMPPQGTHNCTSRTSYDQVSDAIRLGSGSANDTSWELIGAPADALSVPNDATQYTVLVKSPFYFWFVTKYKSKQLSLQISIMDAMSPNYFLRHLLYVY